MSELGKSQPSGTCYTKKSVVHCIELRPDNVLFRGTLLPNFVLPDRTESTWVIMGLCSVESGPIVLSPTGVLA